MAILWIDSEKLVFEEGKTIFEVATANNIYIPHLCARPGLKTAKGIFSSNIIYCGGIAYKCEEKLEYEGCGLCIVSIEGEPNFVHSCSTLAGDGMIIHTDTPEILKIRQEKNLKFIETHPHACLVCPQLKGCDRKICSIKVSEEERCCWKSGLCELQKLVEYIGIEGGLSPYIAQNMVVEENPVFIKNCNLCIGCLRCVVACNDIANKGALGFVRQEGKVIVGLKNQTWKDSGCKLCGVCVDVCPTGALQYKKERKASKFVSSYPPIYPSPKLVPFEENNLLNLPEIEGVYQLFDREKNLYKVVGTENLKKACLDEFRGAGSEIKFFVYEEDKMYTSRERQIIQEYLKKYGRLPPGNDIMSELF